MNKLIFVLLGVVLLGHSVSAADRYWDSNGVATNNSDNGTDLGGSGNWAATPLWWNGSSTSDVAWTAGSSAVFTGTAGTVTLTAPQSANGLTFFKTGYVITGTSANSLTLVSPAAIVVSPDVTASISAKLSNTANLGFSLAGGGTLKLNPTTNINTTTGPVVISGNSVLELSKSADIGSAGVGSGNITLNNGTLRNQGVDVAMGSFVFLTVNRSISIGTGGGTIDVPAAVAIYGNSATSSLNAKIIGTGTLTKTGAGEFRYQGDGTASTSFSKLVVNQGLYRLGNATVSSVQKTSELGFGAAPTTFTADAITLSNGGAIGASFNVALHNNRGITLGMGGGAIDTSAGNMTISGAITGGGALTKTGPNTLTLSGINIFLGNFTITGGTTNFDNDSAASSGNILVTPSSPTTLRNSIPLTTLANNITLNTGSGTIEVLAVADSTLILNGTISGAAGLTRGDGGGTVVLGGNNSGWAGGVTLKQGALSLGHQNALGSADLIVTPNATGATTVPLLSTSVPLTGANAIANNIKINDAGVNLNTLYVTGANDFELAGVISNGAGSAGALNKTGTNKVILSGANIHSGGTKITDGALALGNKSALGGGGFTIGDTATVPTGIAVSSNTNLTGANKVTNGVTVNRDFSIAADASDLELSGGMDLGAAARTITVDSSANSILSGVISNGSLTKAGAGILILSNGGNTYAGDTTLSAGTLKVANLSGTAGTGMGTVAVNGGLLDVTGSMSGGLVSINSGGTMNVAASGVVANDVIVNPNGTLKGYGAINGAVTVAGGTFAPGGSIGTLNIGPVGPPSPSVVLALTAGVFDWEFDTPSIMADLTNVNGAISIASAVTLNGIRTGPLFLPYLKKLTVISYATATLGGPGMFAGAPEGSNISLMGQMFTIRYDDPTAGVNGGAFAHNVTLTAVPEANSLITVGVGGIFAIVVVWLGRRFSWGVFRL